MQAMAREPDGLFFSPTRTLRAPPPGDFAMAVLADDSLLPPLPGESEQARSARSRLARHPAWPSTRDALHSAFSRAEVAEIVPVLDRARALGLWDDARLDASWAAEAFVSGHVTNMNDSSPPRSCVFFLPRLKFFAAAGLSPADLLDSIAFLAASRIEGAARWLDATRDTVLDLSLFDSSHAERPNNPVDWAALSVRFAGLGPCGLFAEEMKLAKSLKLRPICVEAAEASARALALAVAAAAKAHQRAIDRCHTSPSKKSLLADAINRIDLGVSGIDREPHELRVAIRARVEAAMEASELRAAIAAKGSGRKGAGAARKRAGQGVGDAAGGAAASSASAAAASSVPGSGAPGSARSRKTPRL
jgi:hypothetical protein